MTKGRIGITPNRSATVAALLSFGLTGLNRLRRNGARRLRAQDIPALLKRQDTLRPLTPSRRAKTLPRLSQFLGPGHIPGLGHSTR